MRCLSPMNEPAAYLGLLEREVRGVTLLLHAYQVEGEMHTSYSAVGPRQNPEDPEDLLSKEEQWSPMTRFPRDTLNIPFECLCAFCAEPVPIGPAIHVHGAGILHTSCFVASK